MSGLADPSLSQAILIGTSRYDHLPQLPSVERNLADLAAVLKDPNLWGLPDDNCHLHLDTDRPSAVSRALRDAAASVDRQALLLVYFAGHGLIDPEDGSLILGFPGCMRTAPQEEGLQFEWIRRAVAQSPAERRVVILDCCYAGRASAEMAAPGTAPDELADRAEIDDTCLLVAVNGNRTAAAPELARNTAFTGELIEYLRAGLPNGPAVLTVDAIWRHLRTSLVAQGHERPELRARNAGGKIALVRNAAHDRRLAGKIVVGSTSAGNEDIAHAVILLLRHDDSGAVGIRLDQPTGIVPEDFPELWRPLLSNPPDGYGGPLARDGHIVVVLRRPNAPQPLRFTAIRDRLGTVALSHVPEDLTASIDGMRVFCGYLGWGPGELEQDIDDGQLRVTNEGPRTVFSSPDNLWYTLWART